MAMFEAVTNFWRSDSYLVVTTTRSRTRCPTLWGFGENKQHQTTNRLVMEQHSRSPCRTPPEATQAQEPRKLQQNDESQVSAASSNKQRQRSQDELKNIQPQKEGSLVHNNMLSCATLLHVSHNCVILSHNFSQVYTSWHQKPSSIDDIAVAPFLANMDQSTCTCNQGVAHQRIVIAIYIYIYHPPTPTPPHIRQHLMQKVWRLTCTHPTHVK